MLSFPLFSPDTRERWANETSGEWGCVQIHDNALVQVVRKEWLQPEQFIFDTMIVCCSAALIRCFIRLPASSVQLLLALDQA